MSSPSSAPGRLRRRAVAGRVAFPSSSLLTEPPPAGSRLCQRGAQPSLKNKIHTLAIDPCHVSFIPVAYKKKLATYTLAIDHTSCASSAHKKT